jgi:hypothetical protein
LFRWYLRGIWCWGVPLDSVRDLGSEFPRAVCKFTVDMRGNQFDSNIVVRPGHNLKPGVQCLVKASWKWGETNATDDIGVLGAWTNEVVK